MILLTGAAGFIGSNVLAALNARGQDDIICVDDLTNGAKCQNLAGKRFQYYVDYRDVFKIKTSFVNKVVHLGANADTTCTNGAEIVRNNYSFSVKLYVKFNLQNDRPFIYASSAAVYGNDAKQRAIFCERPECERPASPYAVSKWLLDEYMRGQLAKYNTARITGLRFFNVYGPGEQHKGRMRSAVGNMLNDINAGNRPTLFEGSDWIHRDFVWIDDVVKTVLWALENSPRGIFNVGTGVARSFETAYKIVADVAAYDGNPNYVDFPNDLPHYQHYTCADLTRLRAAGFVDDFTSLEEGVAKYWKAFN